MQTDTAERLSGGEPASEVFGLLLAAAMDFLNDIESDPHSDSHSDSETRQQDQKSSHGMYGLVASLFDSTQKAAVEQFISLLEALSEGGCIYEAKMPVIKSDFVAFLKDYSELYSRDQEIAQPLVSIFGPGTDRDTVARAVNKIARIAFYRERPRHVTFYEVAIFFYIIYARFKKSEYLHSIVARLVKCYINDVSRSYETKANYVFASSCIEKFSNRFLPFINGINGMISEGLLDSKDINKLVFILLIFMSDPRIGFCGEFDDYELFYCAVRSLYGGSEYAKRLENFLRTKVLWSFRSDPRGYTVDRVYQTVFKAEYTKYVGRIAELPREAVLLEEATIQMEGRRKDRLPMTVSVVDVTPKLNKQKAVKVFSPFSQRIGEASPRADNFDSKRKLNFN